MASRRCWHGSEAGTGCGVPSAVIMPAASAATCVQCRENAGRYKCPLCQDGGITCSLACSKAHKAGQHGAESVAQATKGASNSLSASHGAVQPPVPVQPDAPLDQQTLLQDYLFLSRMSREVSGIGRALASERWSSAPIKMSKLKTHAGPAAEAELALAQQEAEEREASRASLHGGPHGKKGQKRAGKTQLQPRELLMKQARFLRLPILFLPDDMNLAKTNRSRWLRREQHLIFTIGLRTVSEQLRHGRSPEREERWKRLLPSVQPDEQPLCCLLQQLEIDTNKRLAPSTAASQKRERRKRPGRRGRQTALPGSATADGLTEEVTGGASASAAVEGGVEDEELDAPDEPSNSSAFKQATEWRIDDEAWAPFLRGLYGHELSPQSQLRVDKFFGTLPEPTEVPAESAGVQAEGASETVANAARVRRVRVEALHRLLSVCVPLTRIALRNESSAKHLEWYERQRAKGAIPEYSPFEDIHPPASEQPSARLASDHGQRSHTAASAAKGAQQAAMPSPTLGSGSASLVHSSLLQKLSSQMQAFAPSALPQDRPGLQAPARADSVSAAPPQPEAAAAPLPSSSAAQAASRAAGPPPTLLQVPLTAGSDSESPLSVQEVLRRCPEGWGVVEYPVFEFWPAEDLKAAVKAGRVVLLQPQRPEKELNGKEDMQRTGESSDSSSTSSSDTDSSSSGTSSSEDGADSGDGNTMASDTDDESTRTANAMIAAIMSRRQPPAPAASAPRKAAKLTAQSTAGSSALNLLGGYGSDSDSDDAPQPPPPSKAQIQAQVADGGHGGLASLAQQLGFAPAVPPNARSTQSAEPAQRARAAEQGEIEHAAPAAPQTSSVFAVDEVVWSDDE